MAAQELPLVDAAARLGLTPDAVRLRLRRGKTLQGRKQGREWYVLLDDASSDATGHATDHDRSSDVNGDVPDATTDADASRPVTNDLVDELQSEVQFLRDELRAQREQHAAAVVAWQERLREAHVLLAQRPALPAPSEAIREETSHLPPWWSLARWRAWWRLRDG
jgi:hypothetical protein